jgi:hypothetical protein
LLQLLRGKADFPLLVRAMRAVATLLRDFGKQLVDQVTTPTRLRLQFTGLRLVGSPRRLPAGGLVFY